MPRTEHDIIIQSLGIAADAHAHDVAVWTASRNVALETAITEARQMQIECEELRDRLIAKTYPEVAAAAKTDFIEGEKSCG